MAQIRSEMMGKCIMIIDVQKGFISPETEYVVERIEGLLQRESFDKVIATQFINAEESPYRRFIKWNKLSEPPETDVHEVVAKNADKIFTKNVYSAANSEVLAYLKRNKIDEIFLAGIDTDCCILKTAADFFEKNMDAKVLAYYTASNGGKESRYAAMRVLKRMIGEEQIYRKKYL